jgi:hypothetical protein
MNLIQKYGKVCHINENVREALLKMRDFYATELNAVIKMLY